jgi:hypothetical protein
VFASVGWGEAIIMPVKRREIGSLHREEVKELNGSRGKVKLSRITKRFMAKNTDKTLPSTYGIIENVTKGVSSSVPYSLILCSL